MRPSRRQAAQLAASRISAQASEPDGDAPPVARAPRKATDTKTLTASAKTRRPRSTTNSDTPPQAALRRVKREEEDDYEHEEEEIEQDGEEEAAMRPAKRRKVAADAGRTAQIMETLFDRSAPAHLASLPSHGRIHPITYHRPLLLQAGGKGKAGRDALLRCVDRPARVPDADELREALERRAYEVWISEIMLQQTRVAVVIDYWNRWMAKWPTIRDLARADADEVLLAWRGLGYYSRARRIHEAARLVELEAKVPGIGRYTAGAITSIVFGRAVPMVDGNVLRVLSRQLGIYGNVKTDKATIDTMWAAAAALVKAVAEDALAPEDGEGVPSDAPGRWGQALMELGSTICTPKPACGTCPIRSTCAAFQEGVARGRPRGDGKVKTELPLADMEDLCALCEPFEDVGDYEEGGAEALATKKNGANAGKARKTSAKSAGGKRRCGSHGGDLGRGQKGLLAGLWELPSGTLVAGTGTGPGKAAVAARKSAAVKFTSQLRAGLGAPGNVVKHAGELGSVPWLFSHLKLTMHVQLFTASVLPDAADAAIGDVVGPDGGGGGGGQWRWASEKEIEDESMGTGMRKCWALVRGVGREE
ncbi:unnamed protein product [Parascedosporium putredinis]|uniref:Adenine DNA glycosylase n=1 Tax=Parascedosporium putredinis TaxID=1442378 RepID=A0A9P1H8Y3_9PEZI|nr:unnamed protein product [Parascedosporium putredinis]CAI8002534.1 unnamed protein product [Parascedosporium putredinis]